METTAASGRETERDLILFSDLHLGGDLKRRGLRRAGSLDALAGGDALGRQVASLLDHYAAQPGARWRLVLAGDVVDFIGINVTPADLGEAAPFELSPEEREYGLEAGPERSAWTMRLVARRHPRFFAALGRFLAAGHDLVVVRGNHDLAFVFPEVQSAFTEALSAAAGEDVRDRVQFEDWFYLEPGRIYVEHGHAFDELCAEPGGRPVRVDRPNRLNLPVSAIMLRHFANRFPTLDLDEVDSWGPWRFVHWALVRENPFAIAAAFLQTLAVLLVPRLRRTLRRQRVVAAHPGDERASVAELVARAKTRLARGWKGAERLAHGLARRLHRNEDVDALGVLRIFYLDRAAALGGGALVGVSFGAAELALGTKLAVIAAVVATSIALDRFLDARRQVAIGPKLRSAADEVARLADVPLVVMGHSHRAVDTRVAHGARYVNLGAWAGALRDGERPEGGLPHLVVRGTRAEFLRWHEAPAVRE